MCSTRGISTVDKRTLIAFRIGVGFVTRNSELMEVLESANRESSEYVVILYLDESIISCSIPIDWVFLLDVNLFYSISVGMLFTVLSIIISLIIIILIIAVLVYFIYTSLKFDTIVSSILNPIKYIKYDDFKNDNTLVNSDVPIYVFYHICTKNMDIVEEQVGQLLSSGLYAKATKLYYGCNCSGCDTILKNYMKSYSKFQPMNDAILPDKKSYENETLNSMIEIAKSTPFKFYGLYIHTKGTSNWGNNQQNWRRDMMHWLVNKYQVCTDVLNRGFNTVGIFYVFHYYKRHYAGNFFWATSDYIAKLSPITEVENRYNAEFLLFSKYEKEKHVSLLTINLTGGSLYTVDPNIDKNAPLEVTIV